MREQMEICSSCGSIAPTAGKACGWCKASFETHRKTVSPPEHGLMSVLVEGELSCRGCGAKVPLNYYSTEGYLCGACGIAQQFEPKLWSQILGHAHDTADIAGFHRPDDDDRAFWKMFSEQEGDTAKMFQNVGVKHSCLSKGQTSFKDIPFEMDVSPGVPLCAACHEPLVLEKTQSGLTTRCNGCGATAHYAALPVSQGHSRWVGAVCDEHRTDTRPVTAEASAGGAALALTCPNCSGALKVDALGSLVSCPYCGTQCHVPAHISVRISGKAQPKRRWWLVFEGESKQRRKIQQAASQKEKAAEKKQARNREQQRQQARLKRIEAQKHKRNLILVGVGIAAALLIATAVSLLS